MKDTLKAAKLDHGFPTDPTNRCIAITKKDRQCSQHSLLEIDRCALHAGLARARNDAAYGDPSALAAYKRKKTTRDNRTPGRPGTVLHRS